MTIGVEHESLCRQETPSAKKTSSNWIFLRPRVKKDIYRIYSINRPGRLLNFWTLRVGAYSRWALIRGWALIRINTVIIYKCKSIHAWKKSTSLISLILCLNLWYIILFKPTVIMDRTCIRACATWLWLKSKYEYFPQISSFFYPKLTMTLFTLRKILFVLRKSHS